MEFDPGTRLGPYEVKAALGAGGMGEVYRAVDTRLDREVAIKVLPAAFFGDADRKARFEREAKLLASVNHSGIAAVYAFEELSSRHFLIMELVPGESLDERLKRGALPVGEAVALARQITEALEAAHAKGIVHRDLKPGNVMLTAEGGVKLLDFGLAKAVSEHGALLDSLSPTRTGGTTRAGALLGTPAYMAPEQVRGQAVDGRTDLWALGCVLFEMLTGARAFDGETPSDCLAAVLMGEPAWSALPPDVPATIRATLRACLERDAARRPARASELLASLSMPEEGVSLPSRLVQATASEGVDEFPCFSPGGDRVVFSRDDGGIRRLLTLDLESGEEAALTTGGFDEIHPDWSPDGRTVFFVRARVAGRKLEPGDLFGSYDGGDVWALDLESGRESRIAQDAFNPAVSPDGSRLAFDASWAGPRRLWITDLRGRNPRQASGDTSEAMVHLRPRWSPDGRRLVFQNVEKTRFLVRIVDVETQRLTWVTNDAFLDLCPVWSAAGDAILFSSQRSGGLNLWRLPLDPDLRPAGRLRQLTTGAGQDVGAAVSRDGRRVAFTVLRQNADLWRLPVDPATGRRIGEPEKVIAGTRENTRGFPAPDGSALVFSSDRAGQMNLWLYDIADRKVRPLTRGPGGDYQARFSPDGRTLVFFSCRDGGPDLYRVERDGSGLARLTDNGAINVNPVFSPDGRSIAYQSDLGGRMEVWLMDADGRGQRPLTEVGVRGHFLLFTKDGRSVIFRCPSNPQRTLRVPVEGGEPSPVGDVRGGAHMSLSPDESRIADGVDHKTLWVSPLGEGGEPEAVFAFDDPDVRIDYPVWGPDGRSILFDRVLPRGGDVWILEYP
ncbi:MAG TPA: protein kinase [Vicinamibacteria bacterium]|nr:protein kinase [Vicinamibacteria bacterium]